MAKIIGETGDGLLVSMTHSEIADLLGFYYAGSDNCPRIRPGMDIQIGAIWRRLYALQNAEGHINRLARDMETFARDIKAVEPLIWPKENAEAAE